MTFSHVLVLGTGGVGVLVVRLLAASGITVTAMDRQIRHDLPADVRFITGNAGNQQEVEAAMQGQDAVISCLPFHLTMTAAKAAYNTGIFYFDPTEDVETTNAIREMAKTSKRAMIPQNGLAPGFIGILGAHIAKQFSTLRHIKLRVGALPDHPIGQLGYAGNWSLEGLVHEYIADCDIIADGRAQKIGALKNPEILRINGIEYEAFTTSGGLGTMTETYAGNVETLNYKSIRYPGHLSGMKMLLEELRFREDPDALVAKLAYALPPDDQDRVLIHASVQGELDGKMRTKEIVTDYKPIRIDGTHYTAIAWTTAASIVAVVELVSKGILPQQGFIKQEEIPLKDFLNTSTGRYYAENHTILGTLMQEGAG